MSTEESREREIGKAIVDGYTRIPPGQTDEWGDLEAQLDVLASAMLHRLEQEERSAGHRPW